VAIPQKEDPAVVPARARVRAFRAFRAQERYGLIWVALAEPRWPLPAVLRLGWGGQRGMVAADRCAGYVVIGRNYNTDQPDRVIREFEDTIFGQDQVVVESQRPERVPFDLAAELHLRFDAVAVA
jgi:phenylpropionate dioxygenase-like ring-hydroxylating dioxygenase large terminal subunit